MSSTAPIGLKNGIPTVGPWIAVVFDDFGGPTIQSNLVAARAVNQGTIDNTKTGIVQLGNDTTGSAVGVTGNYATIAGGDANGATGDYSFVAGGQGNLAVSNAHVEGYQNSAYSIGDHAEGGYCSANSGTGYGAHAEGDSTTASADGAHAEGTGTIASGIYSHAEGENSQANNRSSHAEGTFCIANYVADHAEGRNSTATSISIGGAHAEGLDCEALHDGAHAEGECSSAIREGQHAHACGDFAVEGDSQTSILVLRGKTPGNVANEHTSLLYGITPSGPPVQTFTLENGKAYELRVTAICGAVIAAVRSCRRLEYLLAVHCDGGVAVIDGQSASINSVGSAATAAFNLQFTVATNVLTITFYTGVGITAKTAVECRIEFGEVVYP